MTVFSCITLVSDSFNLYKYVELTGQIYMKKLEYWKEGTVKLEKKQVPYMKKPIDHAQALELNVQGSQDPLAVAGCLEIYE